jgi:hypothetical protein
MNILPAKNYTALSTLNQLCLPMDVGVLIPPDDSVRLLVFILKRLDLNPLYEAYTAYREKRRKEQADRDAAFMRMKDETLKAAYNAQLAVEREYITGAGVFATTNDGAAFKPFLEHLKQMLGRSYKKIVADAGYESEEHYAYLEEHQQEAYIKPTISAFCRWSRAI